MKSEGESSGKKTVVQVSTKDKRFKNIASPSEPPKLKSKSGSLIKKFKLRGKSSSTDAQIDNVESVQSSSQFRQTPEGDDSFVLTKSASDTNISENWRSPEGVNEDHSVGSDTKTESNQIFSPIEHKGLFERTKSLENIKNMPAYGELILDHAIAASNANQSTSKPKDRLYKILVIGDLGTGKTSIIKRYVHRFFTQHYRATIGVDFALKVLNWEDNSLIRLQLWDIAGQERYGNMTRVYFKEAVGAFIVFDVTRPTTFESVANWKSDLDSKVQLPDGSPIPCVLLANKCDQQKEGLVQNSAKMDEYCTKNGFAAWFETSARDNINIDDAAKALVQRILYYDTILNDDSKKAGDQFALANDGNSQAKKSSCSC